MLSNIKILYGVINVPPKKFQGFQDYHLSYNNCFYQQEKDEMIKVFFNHMRIDFRLRLIILAVSL